MKTIQASFLCELGGTQYDVHITRRDTPAGRHEYNFGVYRRGHLICSGTCRGTAITRTGAEHLIRLALKQPD